MPIAPIITFKAGKCDLLGKSVKPDPTPGYIYLYSEDDLVHFCWRPRSTPLDEPELDLLMLPTDGSFTPFQPTSSENPNPEKTPTNGRIYALKFGSSSQRYLFWLQSGSQHPNKDPSWFSARDLKLGEIVNTLLLGEPVDVEAEMANLSAEDSRRDGDDDETMEDVEGTNHDAEHHRGGSGGAGPDATGGDIREEGEQSREGGADGGRAAAAGGSLDARSIIQNFVKSLGGQGQASGSRQQSQGKLYTTLQDLLTPTSTVPYLDSIDEREVDRLLQFLPPQLITLAKTADEVPTSNDLSFSQKKSIIARVLRSPQFTQSNASLTVALRDGGLPSIADALGVQVQNNGYMRGGAVPLGRGEAIEAFVEGVKAAAQNEQQQHREQGDDSMDLQ